MSASIGASTQLAGSEAERIHVYARVRPPVSAAAAAAPWVSVNTTCTTLRCGEAEGGSARAAAAQPSSKPSRTSPSRGGGAAGAGSAPQSFTYDGVVGDVWDASTVAFLEQAARSCVADGLLRGTNATVLCCGEKGSGKSTTLFGDAAMPGLCQRIFKSLFANIDAQAEAAAAAAASSPAFGAANGKPPPFHFGGASHFLGEDAAEVQRGMQTRHLVQLSCLALRGENVADLAAEASAAEHGGGGGLLTSGHTPPLLLSASSSSSGRMAVPSPPSTSGFAPMPAAKPSISLDPRGELLLRNVAKVTCRGAADAIALIERCRRARAMTSGAASVSESQQQQQQQHSRGGTSGAGVAGASAALAHVIFVVDVTSEEGEAGNAYHHVVRQSQLYLVDLASVPPAPPRNVGGGSASSAAESQLAGSRAEEAAIRHSLTTLQEVVAHLSSTAAVAAAASVDSPRTPAAQYKQSKLTMLLKGHLGGGCRTLVIAHVRPEEAHKRETLATLQFARRLLCVAERPTARITEDVEVQVRQLQRQVANLQMELRVQMELNAAATVAAHSAVAALSTANSTPTATSGASAGAWKGARQRPGDSPDDATRLQRSSPRSASPINGAGHGARVRADAAQRFTNGSSPVTDIADCHPLLQRSASTATSAAAPTLAKAVKEFIAGRLAVLPVTTVMEMHTCFELLRQCVTEREMQLNAALSDTRAAETAAAAALTTLATTATVAATSARSSISGRSPSSNRVGGNGSGGSGLRRRTGSVRGSIVGSRDGVLQETKRRTSLEQMSPSASTATQPPTLAVSRTTLLSETSPSTTNAAGGKARKGAREGKGFGSGVPAPAVAAAQRDPGTAGTLGGRGAASLSSPPSIPSLSAPPLPLAGHAWPGALMASAAFAPPTSSDDAPSPVPVAPHRSHQGSAAPFTSSSAGWHTSPSAPQRYGGGGTSPLLFSGLDSGPGSAWGSAPRAPLSPFAAAAAPFASQRGWRPQSAPAGVTAAPTPPANSQESKAFHVFTTQTAEGVQQVAQVRHVEELLSGLRQRLRTTPSVWMSGPIPGGAAAASAEASSGSVSHDSVHLGSSSPLSLMEDCRYQEAQLARRREELLRSFEVWYTRRSTPTATTPTALASRPGISGSGAATPASSLVSATSPRGRPGGPTAPPSPQLSLQAMRGRLHRPATANLASTPRVDGSTPLVTSNFSPAPLRPGVAFLTTPVKDAAARERSLRRAESHERGIHPTYSIV